MRDAGKMVDAEFSPDVVSIELNASGYTDVNFADRHVEVQMVSADAERVYVFRLSPTEVQDFADRLARAIAHAADVDAADAAGMEVR